MKNVVSLIMTETDGIHEGVISKYLESLRMRGLRHWTIYNRHRALARLARWAGGPVLYLTESDLRRWQIQRMKEIQPEPLRTDMSHHRQFYRWCVREGFREDDPTIRIDLPRVARRVPRPIRDAQLAAAMVAADAPMCAILALAAFAGLRACEIAGLDWSEMGLAGHYPTMRVTEGKGGHMRTVPISTALISVLRDLPRTRGPVIRRLDGNPGRNQASRISSRANDYLHGMAIDDTLHQCRHRFATAAYQSCQDLRAVQELLGHQTPLSTAIYAAASSDVARAAVEAAGHLDGAA